MVRNALDEKRKLVDNIMIGKYREQMSKTVMEDFQNSKHSMPPKETKHSSYNYCKKMVGKNFPMKIKQQDRSDGSPLKLY